MTGWTFRSALGHAAASMEAEAARVAQFGEPRGRDCYLRHGEDGTPITTLLVGAGLAYELTGLRPECL